MKGSIASIETLTSVDGPGIRTIVFLNGCRKRCLYCHNPEMFQLQKPNYKAHDLVIKILRYKPYFKRGGGVTFSGGEPLLQTDFLIEVCRSLKKEKIHIALDTAGDYKGNIRELLKYVDLIILDIKHTEPAGYLELTKTKMQKINEFIAIINETKIPVSIRQVIVPGYTDSISYIKSLKEYLKQINNIKDITFIPYHKLGSEKYLELNISNPLINVKAMDKKKCDELYQKFLDLE